MPDRLIRTADGFYGGLLVILGVYYLGMALNWFLQPSASRVAGIDWLAVPSWLTHPWTVAAIWLIGGVACVAGGVFSRNKRAEQVAGFAAFAVPFLLSILFATAWALTPLGLANAPRGNITAWSYALPGVIAAWAMIRAPRLHMTGGDHG